MRKEPRRANVRPHDQASWSCLMTRELPPPELLRKIIQYDPDTGEMIWLERPLDMFSHCENPNLAHKRWTAQWLGKPCFSHKGALGYLRGSLHKVELLAHRVAWAVHYGEWPKYHIDHINGVKDDNRITNLRDVPPSVNTRNVRMLANNTSGTMGVTKHKVTGKWHAAIQVNRKHINIGRYDDIEDAIKARKAAEPKYGFHRNHGKPKAS